MPLRFLCGFKIAIWAVIWFANLLVMCDKDRYLGKWPFALAKGQTLDARRGTIIT